MLDCKTRPPIYSSTSASWLNLVERWFGEITRKRIRPDVFTSVPELLAAIDVFIRLTDKNPAPFLWTETAEDILEKIKHGKAVSETQHERQGRHYQVKSTIEEEKTPETRKHSGGDSTLGLGLDGWHNGPGWPSHECSVSP